MNAAFDMPTEMANLAERIVGPVATKLAQQDLDAAIGQIRHVLEQLSTKCPSADVDLENMAENILESVRAQLSEANFTRIVDRLRGAMVGFCQRDEGKAQPDVEPSPLQQSGQSETPHASPNAKSELDAEPWWSTSEQAMKLLILLWLCTAVDWQLH
jgi:hypothetical protein